MLQRKVIIQHPWCYKNTIDINANISLTQGNVQLWPSVLYEADTTWFLFFLHSLQEAIFLLDPKVLKFMYPEATPSGTWTTKQVQLSLASPNLTLAVPDNQYHEAGFPTELSVFLWKRLSCKLEATSSEP